MKDKLVSVIMPVYNAEHTIRIALDSILNQTHTNIEILIADDGSKDDSMRVIDSYTDARIKKFHNTENMGYTRTCNKLFTLATGDFITFQDADDRSTLNRVERLLEAFEKDDKLYLCGSQFVRFNDRKGKELIKSNHVTSDNDIKKHIEERKRLPIIPGTAMFKRDLLNTIGGYRLFYDRVGCEHVDWCLLISEKYPVGNVEDVLYEYCYVSNSFSRVNIVNDFKKYHISDICWFLKKQRNDLGFDALQDDRAKVEFDSYINTLKNNFEVNRYNVYRRVILNRLDNMDFRSSWNLYKDAIKEDRVDKIKISVLFLYRFTRTYIKSIFK